MAEASKALLDDESRRHRPLRPGRRSPFDLAAPGYDVGMLPLDPAPAEMRAMGGAALEYLIGLIGGLDDAPAEATEGALELARELRAAPPETRRRLRAAARRGASRPSQHTFEYSGPGYLAYIPGGGSVHGRARRSSSRKG